MRNWLKALWDLDQDFGRRDLWTSDDTIGPELCDPDFVQDIVRHIPVQYLTTTRIIRRQKLYNFWLDEQ